MIHLTPLNKHTIIYERKITYCIVIKVHNSRIFAKYLYIIYEYTNISRKHFTAIIN